MRRLVISKVTELTAPNDRVYNTNIRLPAGVTFMSSTELLRLIV